LKKTILITGINGYLGSRLAIRYKEKYNIIGLEYDTSILSRIEKYDFEVYASKNGIQDHIFKNHQVDIIIHTATFYGRNDESNSEMLYANTYLPQVLLEKAVKHNCKTFINTDTVLNRYTSPYALTKKQFKDWLKWYANQGQLKVTNLVLEHFYGPGTSNTNFITLMVQKMLNNEPEIALTKAEQNRDFLYIDDLLEVYDLVLEKLDKFKAFEEYNVGAGQNTNLKYILEFIKIHTSSQSRLDYGAIPYRTNELMESSNDVSKLKSLGWTPKISIEDGLSQVINHEKLNLI
jgi:nucleoside-diphosphate-sugar epimerase